MIGPHCERGLNVLKFQLLDHVSVPKMFRKSFSPESFTVRAFSFPFETGIFNYFVVNAGMRLRVAVGSKYDWNLRFPFFFCVYSACALISP